MSTYKRTFTVAPLSGSPTSGSIDNVMVAGIDHKVDALIAKPMAIPQAENSSNSVTTSFYQIEAAALVFVGNPGMMAGMVIGFIEEIIGASSNPITVVDITSDIAGLNSIVGQGYKANPYVWFSENIPNEIIKLHYGIKSSLGSLPESVLLIEPLRIAEVQADTQEWISEIKGTSFDAVVATTKNLTGLDARLMALESSSPLSGQEKEFGIAPEFANMVFDDDGIVDSDGSWLGGLDTNGPALHTFLEWSTNKSTPQAYKIRIMVKLPGDFGNWAGYQPIKVWTKGVGFANEIALNITMNDINGAPSNINNILLPFDSATINSWQEQKLVPVTTGSFMANHWVCITLRAEAVGLISAVKIGRIDFKYITA